jgi:hypothetical protein
LGHEMHVRFKVGASKRQIERCKAGSEGRFVN